MIIVGVLERPLGTFLLGSHNLMVTALGLCVEWPYVKVDRSYMVTFPSSPLLLGYEAHDLYKMVSKIQNEPATTFLMILWKSYEYLPRYQSEDSHAH